MKFINAKNIKIAILAGSAALLLAGCTTYNPAPQKVIVVHERANVAPQPQTPPQVLYVNAKNKPANVAVYASQPAAPAPMPKGNPVVAT
ncbi:MAG: hypothetical protein R3Y52_02080, partial [Psittacicella sp.]